MTHRRLLSHSEIDTALTCWARWDFAYGGHLTGGDTLKPKHTAVILSEGRAWGAAVATWHATGGRIVPALDALHRSLDDDEERLREFDLIVDDDQRDKTQMRLDALLAHYATTATVLDGLTLLEHELVVPIPSRTGRRRSSRYSLLAKIDGYLPSATADRPWVVEFKLRQRLHTVALMEKAAQFRWYSWALREAEGLDPFGMIVDERLNEAPKDVRIVNAKRKGEGVNGKTVSHARDQVTTVAAYLDACAAFDAEPDDETVAALQARVWQHRHHIMFRNGELDEAGRQLVAAGRLIQGLDSGAFEPIRHATPRNCGGCRFEAICPNPRDDLYVDSLYERTVPKRLRDNDNDPEVVAT